MDRLNRMLAGAGGMGGLGAAPGTVCLHYTSFLLTGGCWAAVGCDFRRIFAFLHFCLSAFLYFSNLIDYAPVG